MQQTEALKCLLEPKGIDTVSATISNVLYVWMCETFSKEGKSSIEAAAIENMQGKIFLRCVTLSNWKGKAANAMQRVLQDVLHHKEAKQLERKNCKRKRIDILTIREAKQL